MRGDKVILRSKVIGKYRRQNAISRVQFCGVVGVHYTTGQRMMNDKPVSLGIAQKVAGIIDVKIQDIIESWVDQAETVKV